MQIEFFVLVFNQKLRFLSKKKKIACPAVISIFPHETHYFVTGQQITVNYGKLTVLRVSKAAIKNAHMTDERMIK
jgi:hypothetical protein